MTAPYDKPVAEMVRIMTRPIKDDAHLLRELEMHAILIHDKLIDAQTSKDPHWWNFQDMLDDVLEMWEYVKNKEE